jgi:ribosomal protein S27AE
MAVTDGDGNAMTATYECPECDNSVTLSDFDHRTHVGYTASTVRCPDHDEPMERVE